MFIYVGAKNSINGLNVLILHKICPLGIFHEPELFEHTC